MSRSAVPEPDRRAPRTLLLTALGLLALYALLYAGAAGAERLLGPLLPDTGAVRGALIAVQALPVAAGALLSAAGTTALVRARGRRGARR